jgi:hypothetical protein
MPHASKKAAHTKKQWQNVRNKNCSAMENTEKVQVP